MKRLLVDGRAPRVNESEARGRNAKEGRRHGGDGADIRAVEEEGCWDGEE